jgi:hypothetical protein
MAWLRLDDGFTANSKIAQLSDAEFRAWMRLLCHCARSRDPSVDEVAIREVSGLNSRRIRRYADLGLLDEIGSHFEVHDWAKYLPKDATNADRQARWRARQRNARNDEPGVTPGVTKTSHTRAGTRGVPSRPVLEEQEQNLRASERELQDAASASDEPTVAQVPHRSPAEQEAEDPEPVDPEPIEGPLGESVRTELARLQARGATA